MNEQQKAYEELKKSAFVLSEKARELMALSGPDDGARLLCGVVQSTVALVCDPECWPDELPSAAREALERSERQLPLLQEREKIATN